MTFKEMNLNEDILLNLQDNNFNNPTEIQEQAIPALLNNENIFGKSSTGTGKTASFVLPILQKIDINKRSVQAIILAPTRELAKQILDQIIKFSKKGKRVGVAALIGGDNIHDQFRRLKNAHVVVGTPGRVKDHLDRKSLLLDKVNIIILDEADEMLKMGFKSEIDEVFAKLSKTVQIGLFSATMNKKVETLANQYMDKYKAISINNEMKVNDNISNTFFFTKGVSKEQLISKLFEKNKFYKTIIFTNTKSNTDRIAENLKSLNIDSLVINGDKKQSQRSRAIKLFKEDKVNVLVATDVLARGIDISDVSSIINYDISIEDEVFLHRIGRTGRNGKKGESISFIQNDQTLRQLKAIASKYNLTIDEISVEEYGLEKRARNKPNSEKRFSSSKGGSNNFDRRREGRSSERKFGDRNFSRDRKSKDDFGFREFKNNNRRNVKNKNNA
ncbi:DEAD/DEAH box helicase [Spiroplasma endosymbiont of Crioceris asparagi]|uniref:DEAD/DEAH box helicase n=1 Tax=Spiroplasma endosymbiont of Crioceris asparagi TaxID=3066286 RepID=UPI0030D392BE